MSPQGPALVKSTAPRTEPQSPAPLRSVGKPRAASKHEDEINFTELLGTLIEQRLLIGVVAAVTLALGTVYALAAAPVYRADALVQVEQKSSGLAALSELGDMFSGKSEAQTEIELIRSRAVIGDAVRKLHLDIRVTPRRLPFIGRTIARRHEGSEPATAVLGLEQFAWGGEVIEVAQLEVPEELLGKGLTLRAEAENGFRLFDPAGAELLRGRVGSTATGPAGVTIRVDQLVARPGTEFRIAKQPWAKALAGFGTRLKVGERAKNSGIIELSLEGDNPEEVAAALQAVADGYVRRNVERKSEEAEKTLAFINSQLPLLKSNLESAEVALNRQRARQGTVALTVEAEKLIEQAAAVEKQIVEVELQRAEMRQRFTGNHPALQAVEGQLQRLRTEKARFGGRIQQLPTTELESVRLLRDLKVAEELYLLLLNKAQELSVLKSGTVGNVRVVDGALLLPEPVKPKRSLLVAGSLALGLGLGIALALGRRALRSGITDPSVIEEELSVPVLATVPHSGQQERMLRVAQRRKLETLTPLALSAPSDRCIESLRSLRTSLQFALLESGNNVVVVGGPRPGVGKTFVSVNLAYVLAGTGKRVLLVDADMRKGYLHRYFSGGRGPGLAELILEGRSLEDVVRHSATPGLDFVATGELPANPSELLGSKRFEQTVARMSDAYDLVLLDAPPVLAVTDAALLARLAGVNLLVAKAGIHPLRELELAIARLEQSGARVNGFVLNDIAQTTSRLASGYQYQYDYE